MPTSKELAKLVCDILLDDMPVGTGEEIAVNLNGLGGLTYMEFSIFYKDIYNYLTRLGIKVFDVSCGNNMTTQELGGFILSIGKVDDEVKYWWKL
jgi:phosphoenolpyruvate---glycerone phosphotransferase subunit DhaK